MSTNPLQGHSNLAVTTVCGGVHQIATSTMIRQQPQYSGLLESVNTKCCMSATSSQKPIFVQVFLENIETHSRHDFDAARI